MNDRKQPTEAARAAERRRELSDVERDVLEMAVNSRIDATAISEMSNAHFSAAMGLHGRELITGSYFNGWCITGAGRAALAEHQDD